jgi:hypothetical protein
MTFVLLRAVFVLFVSLSVGAVAEAGSFEKVSWRGHEALDLTGVIDEDLVKDFMRKRDEVQAWEDGSKVMLLDSPGGGVMAALAIVGMMDKESWHTVIQNGAKCASACASILFVSGTYRTVEPLGALGQHSCASGGLPDAECNELMAQNAMAHGVSHGSIKAFTRYTDPKNMLWFSREDADGWGLTRYPGEKESGFQKSEPRVISMLTGRKPQAQSAWRIDFQDDGFKAFVRTVSDDEREMQLNTYCYEFMPGTMFVGMEINGPEDVVKQNVVDAWLGLDGRKITQMAPIIRSADPMVTEVIMPFPKNKLTDFLTKADEFVFNVTLRPPYTDMRATTYLKASRKNLIFAANHCAHGFYGLDGQRLR